MGWTWRIVVAESGSLRRGQEARLRIVTEKEPKIQFNWGWAS
jgi:hypothetical protein